MKDKNNLEPHEIANTYVLNTAYFLAELGIELYKNNQEPIQKNLDNAELDDNQIPIAIPDNFLFCGLLGASIPHANRNAEGEKFLLIEPKKYNYVELNREGLVNAELINSYSNISEIKRKFDFIHVDNIFVCEGGESENKIFLTKEFKQIAKLLNKDGLFFVVAPEYSFENLNRISLLNKEGLSLEAVFGLEQTSPENNYFEQNLSVFLISNRRQKDIFFASLKGYSNLKVELLLNYYEERESNNLDEGTWLPKESIKAFEVIQSKENINKYNQQNTKLYTFGDVITNVELCENVNMYGENLDTKVFFINKNFYLVRDIPSATMDLNWVRPNFKNYIKVEVNKLIDSRYLAIFFASDLGKDFLITSNVINNDYEIDIKKLKRLKIPIVSLEEQQRTIIAKDKLNKISDSFEKFCLSFDSNPIDFSEKEIEKLDNLLENIDQLSDAERILNWIKKGIENSKVEFKESWKYPTKFDKSKGQDFDNEVCKIEVIPIKVINSFLNTNGGSLIIGVRDEDMSIQGIDQELEHYYKKHHTIEKRLDTFKQRFGQQIDNAFEPYFREFIDINSIEINGKVLIEISCAPSDKQCFISDKYFKNHNFLKNIEDSKSKRSSLTGRFYKRTPTGDCVPLEGDDLVQYCIKRFVN